MLNCSSNSEYIYAINFGTSENDSCDVLISTIQITYTVSLFFFSLFLPPYAIMLYSYCNSFLSQVNNRLYLKLLILSTIVMLISVILWMTDSLLIILNLSRSNTISRYIFWFSLATTIISYEIVTGVFKKIIQEMVQAQNHRQITRLEFLLLYLVSISVGCMILGLALVSSWLDGLRTNFHISIASIWILILLIHQQIILFYDYKRISAIVQLANELKGNLKSRNQKPIFVLKTKLGQLFYFRILTIILFILCLCSALAESQNTETCFEYATIVLMLESLLVHRIFSKSNSDYCNK